MAPSRTVWVLGDQLNAGLASIRDADPARDRILMIRSEGKIASKPFHPLRLRLVLEAMGHFAEALRRRGFQVDHRTAATFAEGVEAHRREFRPASVRAMEPMSWDGLRTMGRLGVVTVRSDQFLCHHEEFAEWAAERPGRLVMEDFDRRQRVRLGDLMDGDEPAGGRWNWDAENRRPPPRDGGAWPRAGRDADWPVTRRQALARLPAPDGAREPGAAGRRAAAGAGRLDVGVLTVYAHADPWSFCNAVRAGAPTP